MFTKELHSCRRRAKKMIFSGIYAENTPKDAFFVCLFVCFVLFFCFFGGLHGLAAERLVSQNSNPKIITD